MKGEELKQKKILLELVAVAISIYYTDMCVCLTTPYYIVKCESSMYKDVVKCTHVATVTAYVHRSLLNIAQDEKMAHMGVNYIRMCGQARNIQGCTYRYSKLSSKEAVPHRVESVVCNITDDKLRKA